MRIVLPLLFLALPAAALASDSPAPVPLPSPGPPGLEQLELGPPELARPEIRGPADCRDKIYQVREERGLPRLERGTAAPGEPLLIAAVDQRLDGCSVLVMKQGGGDIRPLPRFEGPPRLIPLR